MFDVRVHAAMQTVFAVPAILLGILLGILPGILLVILFGILGCSAEPGPDPSSRIASPIELAQRGSVFDLVTTLLDERSRGARTREAASSGTGALLVPFVDGAGNPLLASNGSRVRGTCGVTFIAPSYAVTAAHCVDGTKADLQGLVLEMYRPTSAIDPGFKRAASLDGAFPDFEHAKLGGGDGYFVDQHSCTLVSRCAGLYGGPVNCDSEHSRPSGESDTALVRCEGTPGLRYGFAAIAEADDSAAEVFLPWKHEIYDVPSTATDERWLHYVVASANPADNYHYMGGDSAGVEQNQLLPLMSVDHADGTPHRKLSRTAFSVSTDLLGCHGTSGAGALQQADNGLWRLLGPISGGNSEHNTYLCNHIPSLDGFSREPGTLGLSYMALDVTQYIYARNRSAIETDCDPMASGATTVFTHLPCQVAGLRTTAANAAFADTLTEPRAIADLDIQRGQIAALSAGQTITLTGFNLRAGARYRVGLSAWSSTGCRASLCPRLSVAVDEDQVLAHSFETASDKPIPLGATFAADRTGIATLSFTVDNGDQFELGAITVLLDGAANSFDTMPERLSALLVDLAATPDAPRGMRFVGDGIAGFSARLLPNERIIVDRQAIAAGRRWTARFSVSPPTRLTCGLVDAAGQVVRQSDCSSGSVQIDDTAAPFGTRAGFFIQTPTDSAAVEIDDLRIASDAASDTDGDRIPDAVDPCPQGPLPPGQLQIVTVPDGYFSACAPEPTTVVVPLPQVRNACDQPTLSGRLSAVNGNPVNRSLGIVPDTRQLLLPMGSHTISWEVKDGAGNIYATLTGAVTVVHNVGPHCCNRAQILTPGSTANDVVTPGGASAACVLADAGDDFVVTGSAADWLWGGSGGDYMVSGGGDDVLSGGAGADYLAGGTGGALTVYAGPGDDTVHARFAASARIFGGSGADVLIGGDGPDAIYPGPGMKLVLGGKGADVVTIYDVCELSPGTHLDGGDGWDRLVSPVPRQVLISAGVLLEGFEDIVVDATRTYLSECFPSRP